MLNPGSNECLFSAVHDLTRLCGCAVCRELARRLKEKKMPITANALCPGLVATDLGRYLVDGAKWYMKPFTALIIPVMMSKAQTIPQGASTALHLALSDDVEVR